MEMIVDLLFPLRGRSVPLDHGYALFSAVSRILPDFHERRPWSIHPVAGTRVAPGVLELGKHSRLIVRAPAEDIHRLLPLAGRSLDLEGHRVVVGAPSVVPLRASRRLRSRFVTIKGGHGSPEAFRELAERAIERLASECDGLRRARLSVGERRVMRIASHTVVGFPVELPDLDDEASLFVQRKGLGGRRHMGAGVFVPARA